MVLTWLSKESACAPNKTNDKKELKTNENIVKACVQIKR